MQRGLAKTDVTRLVLLVPVRVGQSSIHGLGAFAVTRIAKGTPIWRFTPGFDLALDPRLVDEQPAHFRQALLHYGYIDHRLKRFILCCDDARFINHSDAPNVGIHFDLDPYGVDIALRDIAAGEEITVDYQLVEGARPERSLMPRLRDGKEPQRLPNQPAQRPRRAARSR